MAKRYVVQSPEELRALSHFLKDGSVEAVATVWNATRRKNGGKSPWNGKILASFYTQGASRSASVLLILADGSISEFAYLKYTPALQYCRSTLTSAD